eukprot:10023419-Ditylum_brightwellii.AAC.1
MGRVPGVPGGSWACKTNCAHRAHMWSPQLDYPCHTIIQYILKVPHHKIGYFVMVAHFIQLTVG